MPGDALRAHARLMLLGLVLMSIYGIGLHVLLWLSPALFTARVWPMLRPLSRA